MTQQNFASSGLKPAFAWYRFDAACVVKRLHSSETGLSAEEARLRLTELGRNQLCSDKDKSTVRRFFSHFNNVLIYGPLAAAGLGVILGHGFVAAVISGVVIFNVGKRFTEENKAQEALQDKEKLLPPQARVMRNGQVQTIDARELVEGDIVVLQAGDGVPADMRLLEADSLLVNQAALTGSAMAVSKQTATIATEVTMGHRDNLVFCGTTVSAGRATGIVIATGSETELGRMNQ
ncbi:cation-transporting P-type ATPase [Pantoea sp. MBD-2R]|uniref:P-type ATPase n=1 Tax=Pantoea sp. MBD-2R TaxID=3141540 RepID=UPI00318307F8